MASKNATETIRADDFVEYFLFPDLSEIKSGSKNEEDFLRDFLQNVSGDIKPHLEHYIWHKDPFRLIPRCGNSNLLNEEHTENEGEFDLG